MCGIGNSEECRWKNCKTIRSLERGREREREKETERETKGERERERRKRRGRREKHGRVQKEANHVEKGKKGKIAEKFFPQQKDKTLFKKTLKIKKT